MPESTRVAASQNAPESASENVVEPRAAGDTRLPELDVLRGFALLGIFWINVVVFALPYGAYSLPTMLGGNLTANTVVWAFSELFVEGSMRGLFSLLFGASAMLLLDDERIRRIGVHAVEQYYRRALYLMLFGLLHAYVLLWPYDVLYAYGLIGMFLFPLRKLTPWLLVFAGCFLLAVGDMAIKSDPGFGDEENKSVARDGNADHAAPAATLALNAGAASLPRDSVSISPANIIEDTSGVNGGQNPQAGGAESGHESVDKSDEETDADSGLGAKTDAEIGISRDVQLYQSGYATIFMDQIDDVIEQQSKYMYTTHVFDIGGMMLIGMGLFKLGVLTGRFTPLFYLVLMCIGYLIGGASRGWDVYNNLIYDFAIPDEAVSEWAGYNLSRLALALGHVGAIGYLCKARIGDFLSLRLAAVGRLALSNYIGQTVIAIFLFYGFGLGLFAALDRYELIFVCLLVWSVQIYASRAWLRSFRLGPLEWLLRCLIHGRREPIRLPVTPAPRGVGLEDESASLASRSA